MIARAQLHSAGRGGFALCVLLLALGLSAACRGGGEEAERGVVERVTALLAHVPRESVVRLSPEDTLHVSAATRQFYRWRLNRSAWTNGKRLLPQGKQIHEAIGLAGDDGLSPRSYGWDIARAMVARLDSVTLSAEQRAALLGELDLVLTEGFGRYARDLIQGTIDPDQGGLDWRIPRDTTLAENVLKAARSERVAEIVARLRPATPHYGRLLLALARYRAVEARGGWPQVPAPEPGVRAGLARGATVAALRLRLLAGEDTVESRRARYGEAHADLFDDSLRAALARFQSRNGIDEDGALGANTLRELNHSVEDRIADLRLNLDRWRWMPRELGARYIVVNVAGFELELIEDGRAVENMSVVVGKEGWNTPIFSDTMESLVVNPSWNVPESIATEEILPGLRRDPGYLAAHHFDVLIGERVVNVAQVDLSKSDTYRFRQRPGPDNALGRLKFLLPNSDNIYLHDTPAGHLFSRAERAFSHGCIRLEQPEALARALLQRVTGTAAEELDTLLAGGKETTIRFREGVPIYILYFTAWVDEDGTVRFLHDVYGRDEKLEPQRQRLLEHPTPAGRGAARTTEETAR
jgi:murein L,D-transpeptidase YcbB/YkuD